MNNKQFQECFSQYTLLVNEYRQILLGVQNILTINLAVSVAIIAAYVLLLVNNTALDKIPYSGISYILLSLIGLAAALLSIKTIESVKPECKELNYNIVLMEKKLEFIQVHSKNYYKPIYITMCSLYLFATLFGFILAYVLGKFFPTINSPSSPNLVDLILYIDLILSIIEIISKILEKIYKSINIKYTTGNIE